MGTFFGFKQITASPRRDSYDAERRTTNGNYLFGGCDELGFVLGWIGAFCGSDGL